ncbi:MAG TPA: hypothetical protein ENN03_00675 [bacterium]|nr:hypothetical protein [bacterium]
MKISPKIFTLAAMLAFSHAAFPAQNEKYELKYQFKEGQTLRYQTERHDSTQIDFGGQNMERSVTIWSRQSLNVHGAEKDGTFSVQVKTDTMWTNQEEGEGPGTVVFRQGAGPGRGSAERRSTARMGGAGRQTPEEYTIDAQGRSVSKDPVTSQLILPLPEEPVALNESWDFEYTVELRGRAKGRTNVSGQCLLYSVEKQNGDEIALIIVTGEARGSREIQGEAGGVSFSSTSESSGSGTRLVYFNVTQGFIQEIYGEETEETASDMRGNVSSIRRKTNSTVKRVE